MNRHETSEMLGRMIDEARGSRQEQGLALAKQALDILITLEERLPVGESVTIEDTGLGWTARRDYRTHLGSDLADALGQLCQTLAME